MCRLDTTNRIKGAIVTLGENLSLLAGAGPSFATRHYRRLTNNNAGVEGVAIDAKGNVYGAEVSTQVFRKYQKS